MFSTHERQKVHSKVQIIASAEFGGSAALQFSHVGLSWSMTMFWRARRSCPTTSREGSADEGAPTPRDC